MGAYSPDRKPTTCPFFGASYSLRSLPPLRVPAAPELPQLVIGDAAGQQACDVDLELLRADQSLVGALLYASINTRPDVAYTVGMLGRAMGKPTSLPPSCTWPPYAYYIICIIIALSAFVTAPTISI